jgi:pSer/pThr/pTyr-binding forkhead associated (FHA) protein
MDLWCDQRLIVRVIGPDGCEQVATCGPFARVGSHPGSDVVLPGTAKRTLYLHATAAGVYCLDLRDHADVNSEQSGRWVRSETSIAVEGYALSVSLEPVAKSSGLPQSLLARNLVPRPTLAFRITCKGGPKAKYKIHRPLTVVGRDTTCGLNLSGTKVSSPHCVLFCDQGRIWCVDLLSNNGTLLNGQSCEVAEVHTGDRLTIGEFRLLHCGQAAAPAALMQGDSSLFSKVNLATRRAPEVESLTLEASDRSTVQLSKGDTVNVKLSEQSPAERGKPKADVTRNLGQPSARVELSVGEDPLPGQAVDEAMSKLDAAASLPAELRVFMQRLEEQDKLLLTLRGTLEAEQERWRLERDSLRYELTTQATVIRELKRELAVARATLDRQVSETRASSSVASIRGEIQGKVAEAGSGLVAIARGSQSVAIESEQGSGHDRAVEHERPEYLRDDQVAERETIHNVESMHSTVVWQQFQQAIAGSNEPRGSVNAHPHETAIREEVDRRCQMADRSLKVVNQPSPAPGRLPLDRRNELSQFVNERLHELDQSRMKYARLAGAGLALGLVVAGVFASWWLGAF